MKITYANKKKVIEHPSGHIDRVSIADMNIHKADIEKQIAQLQSELASVNSDLTKMSAAIGAIQ